MAPWHSAFRCFACIVGLYGLASTSDLVSGSPTPITHSCIDICSRLQPQDNTRVRWICGCWGMFAAVPKREHVSGGVCFRGHAELIHGITTLCMCVSVSFVSTLTTLLEGSRWVVQRRQNDPSLKCRQRTGGLREHIRL